jgi:hypothetical protein
VLGRVRCRGVGNEYSGPTLQEFLEQLTSVDYSRTSLVLGERVR